MYAVVDFEGFRDVINAMGGVEIDVEDEIPPRKYGIKDGLRRLTVPRRSSTLATGARRGDMDRIEHQQRLIAAPRSKAFGLQDIACPTSRGS